MMRRRHRVVWGGFVDGRRLMKWSRWGFVDRRREYSRWEGICEPAEGILYAWEEDIRWALGEICEQGEDIGCAWVEVYVPKMIVMICLCSRR
jgi:hypothetical protein